MKTAEELWEANKRHTDGNFKGYTIRKNDFIKLIEERDQQQVSVEPEVKVNFADIKKEFEEKFCFQHTTMGTNIVDGIIWRNADNAKDVWGWFEQKLKEASKISA